MNASPYPSVQNIPEVAGQNAQAAQSVQLSANQGVNNGMNPILQALKIIGSSINAGKQRGNPQAGAQSQAFSGLLQSMASPELSQGQAQPQSTAPGVPATPATPQPGAQTAMPVQPQAQPVQPAPAAGGGQAPAPAARPNIPRRPLNPATPFGQQAGARPMSKQPINI